MSNVGALGGGSSGGVTGQLDVQWIVEQIIYAKQQPIRDLEVYEVFYEAKKEAFQELNTKVSAIESALYNINTGGFGSKSASVSSETYLTANATSTASTGTYNIIVDQMATAQSSTSNTFTDAGDSTALYDGVLTIKDSTDTTTLGTVDFTGQYMSLNDLKDEINSLGLDVTATVIQYGTDDYRLALTSDETGEDNGFNVSAAGTTVPTFTDTVTAQNAQVYVNTDPGVGDFITRSTNTIDDIIEGVTLTLEEADDTKTTVLTVSSDSGAVKENIQTFVDAFNDAMEFLNGHFTYDQENERAGVLSGEAAARKIKEDLLTLASSSMSGAAASDDYTSFALIGVELTRQGTMEIDDTTLDDVLANNLDSVMRVFKNVGTSDSSQVTYLGKTDDTKAGTYEVIVTQAAEQAVAKHATEILDTLGGDETLTFTYNGNDTTVDLTSGDGPSTVVSNINTALDDAGIPAFARIADDDRLEIVTNAYGSAANDTLSVVSDVDAAEASGSTGIGTSSIAVSGGADVDGTVGGDAASGKGRTLTSSEGNSNGMKLYITTEDVSGPTSKGDVYVTYGVGEALRERMYEVSFPYTGIMAKNIESFENKLENISDKITSINRQLVAEQEILILQFTKANEALAEMNYLKSTISKNMGG